MRNKLLFFTVLCTAALMTGCHKNTAVEYNQSDESVNSVLELEEMEEKEPAEDEGEYPDEFANLPDNTIYHNDDIAVSLLSSAFNGVSVQIDLLVTNRSSTDVTFEADAFMKNGEMVEKDVFKTSSVIVHAENQHRFSITADRAFFGLKSEDEMLQDAIIKAALADKLDKNMASELHKEFESWEHDSGDVDLSGLAFRFQCSGEDYQVSDICKFDGYQEYDYASMENVYLDKNMLVVMDADNGDEVIYHLVNLTDEDMQWSFSSDMFDTTDVHYLEYQKDKNLILPGMADKLVVHIPEHTNYGEAPLTIKIYYEASGNKYGTIELLVRESTPQEETAEETPEGAEGASDETTGEEGAEAAPQLEPEHEEVEIDFYDEEEGAAGTDTGETAETETPAQEGGDT